MKVYRNLPEIQRKERLGRRFSLTGLAILFLGMMSSFIPNWYPTPESATTELARTLQLYWPYFSFFALPAGFVCASIGSYYINRFARRRWPGRKLIERPDEVLERTLKGLDDKYALFLWSLPQASQVLVGPCGILTFATRSDKGRVQAHGDKWREPFSIGRIFTVFAREGVGNPRQEIEEQANKLRQFLGQYESEVNLADIPIDGAVVFLNDEVELDLQNPSAAALRSDQVKTFVREKARQVKLQTSMLRAVTRYLEEHSNYTTVEEE